MSRNTRKILTTMAAGVVSATVLVACSSEEAKQANGDSSTGNNDGDKSGAITLTDIAGREVTLEEEPERIILGEGRSLFATGILNTENPLDKIVGIGTDLKQNVPDYYNRLEEKLPEVSEIPEIGGLSKGDVTVENLLSMAPDLVVLSMDTYEASEKAGLTTKMDEAGVEYVVTDFRAKPLQNTTKSMELFGQIFGQEQRAEEFNKDWQEIVDLVQERAAKVTEKPKTFVWRAAGVLDCCGSWNDSNISQLVNTAGGDNVGDHVIEGESGALTPEKVLESDPDMIIATGGDWSEKKDDQGNPVGYAAVGYGIDESEAKASIAKLPEVQPGFESLRAVKDNQLHALWHQFYNSPFNYLALLQIAQWINPEAYEDIDVEQKWLDSQKKYSPISGEGTLFSTN
ncbi:ABC transporter substrate-binding protein [Corynebacterium pseudodiphtheriticum]|uniref:ABC transporter substrate-binding protein n=1 Tax=Corynebacterium pseudodiphtheriticum TaxID=37637 RepID=UPI00254E1382|nr:ABC transporter substrate-binding protein [Corynebacterium pseudodiphtheriticum]MDK8685061.1 ABC transporter substrate-binding protein [Corynebacterium pseudodiphtheriticum]